MGWRLAQLPLVTLMEQEQEQDQMFSHSPYPPSDEKCLICAAIVFSVFDGCGSEDLDDFYSHVPLVAVMVGPLTLMTSDCLFFPPSSTRCQCVPIVGRKDLGEHKGYWGYWAGCCMCIYTIETEWRRG